MRQVVLDTETTGLDPAQGHRIIEVGCVEVVDRRCTGSHFHEYLQPDREIDPGAMEVHGITNEFLNGKPRFKQVLEPFLAFIRDAQLIIHNAPFDVGFINRELSLVDAKLGRIEDYCQIIDTLALARDKHPGQKNNLDALCRRYAVDNSERNLHGALLDAEILADVYLAMTGGQASLNLEVAAGEVGAARAANSLLPADRVRLKVIRANADELRAHESVLDALAKQGGCVWRDR